jgi:hypothetical protein
MKSGVLLIQGRGWLAFLASLWAVGCARSHEQANAMYYVSQRSGVCSIHHIALQQVVMYDLTQAMPADLSEVQIRLWEQYPNTHPDYMSTRSADFGRPMRVRICPICQRLYDKAIERYAVHHSGHT